ncbi:hypothetical protein Rhopal_004044-T1 [Rhodotorula paludigena]|uniref:HNH nuclease domain-containing protein n=1 Tax=Rhodotorula paludigena TaxID=86838 RepID=A0AAV5GKN0_9BASI|nr:hypothetical protein Rhopal_004044-T1 [Rhodotorula paludigena]
MAAPPTSAAPALDPPEPPEPAPRRARNIPPGGYYEAPDVQDDDFDPGWQSAHRESQSVPHDEPAEEEKEDTTLPAYTLPIEGDSRMEEEAACIHALFATWSSWVMSSADPPELRFRRAARVFREKYSKLYKGRCAAPTSSFFDSLLNDWASSATSTEASYDFVVGRSNLTAAKMLLYRSYAGNDGSGFISPLDEISQDLRSLGLGRQLTEENIKAHLELLNNAAQIFDGGNDDQASVSSLHSSDRSNASSTLFDDEVPDYLQAFVYLAKLSAASRSGIAAERMLITNGVRMDAFQAAHIIPHRPSKLYLLFAVKIMTLLALNIFYPNFTINMENEWHPMFDKDAILILPHRPFLLAVLEHVHTSGRNLQGADKPLYVLLDELAAPHTVATLPYTVYALRPAVVHGLILNDISSENPYGQPYLSSADGLFRNQAGEPLGHRIFSRTETQASAMAFIINGANKIIFALQKEDFKLPPAVVEDALLCVSIVYHLICNAAPHGEMFERALSAASLASAKAHTRLKRKHEREGAAFR